MTVVFVLTFWDNGAIGGPKSHRTREGLSTRYIAEDKTSSRISRQVRWLLKSSHAWDRWSSKQRRTRHGSCENARKSSNRSRRDLASTVLVAISKVTKLHCTVVELIVSNPLVMELRIFCFSDKERRYNYQYIKAILLVDPLMIIQTVNYWTRKGRPEPFFYSCW